MQVLLYRQSTCTFCFVEFLDSLLDEYFIKVRFLSQLKRMGPLGPLPWKVVGHILKSWNNGAGPP